MLLKRSRWYYVNFTAYMMLLKCTCKFKFKRPLINSKTSYSFQSTFVFQFPGSIWSTTSFPHSNPSLNASLNCSQIRKTLSESIQPSVTTEITTVVFFCCICPIGISVLPISPSTTPDAGNTISPLHPSVCRKRGIGKKNPSFPPHPSQREHHVQRAGWNGHRQLGADRTSGCPFLALCTCTSPLPVPQRCEVAGRQGSWAGGEGGEFPRSSRDTDTPIKQTKDLVLSKQCHRHIDSLCQTLSSAALKEK